MKTVAIHQVNFFPWLPFFHKIAAVDQFILLDDVQYERTGAGSWQNRVRLSQQGKEYWLTCPLDRSIPKTSRIMDMQLHSDRSWQRKAIKKLHHDYSKAAYFDEIFPTIKDLVEQNTDSLVQYNEKAIRSLCKMLDLSTKIIRSSELGVTTTSTQRLIDLVKSVGGSAYYAGRNATATYQDNDAFNIQNIKLLVENYTVPPYTQVNSPAFVPGLSVIDALMNIGPSEAKKLLHSPVEKTQAEGGHLVAQVI